MVVSGSRLVLDPVPSYFGLVNFLIRPILTAVEEWIFSHLFHPSNEEMVMGFVGDFLRFLASVILGLEDRSETYREALMMAERYMHWGEQRADMRDFLTAHSQLQRCQDETVSAPELILRKNTLLCDIIAKTIDLLVLKYKEKVEALAKGEKDRNDEIAAVEADVRAMEKKIAQLESEGSLIKAKEEKKLLETTMARLLALRKLQESNEEKAARLAAYSELSAECERMCQEVEASVADLERNDRIPASARNELKEYVAKVLADTRAKVAALQP